MTSTLRSCVSELSHFASDTYKTVSAGLKRTPACYATASVIRAQRITGVSLFAIGCITAAYAPIVGPVAGAVGTGLTIAGASVIGLSLIQQAIGGARGCENAKLARIVAGVNFLCPHPFNWFMGGVLWSISELHN